MSRSTTRSTGGSSSGPSPRRGVTLVALGIAGVVALGGCSAGQIAQTAANVPAIPGVNGNVGNIAVRNAEVSFPAAGYHWPAGSDVPLELRIIDTGVKSDQLISASSDLASSVTLQVVPEGGQASQSPTVLPSVPTGTPTPTSSGRPNPPASRGTAPGLANPSLSASASSGPSFPLTLPAQQVTSLTAGGAQLVLKGISAAIDPSTVVPVTLRFAQAGTVTLQVPFGSPATPLPRESLSGSTPPPA